jgi:hypothetical protein
MMTSNFSPLSASAAEFPQKGHMIGDGGAVGPMPQQDTFDAHGHEMYPQKFVRLVGCHGSDAGKHEAVQRLH